MRKITVYSGLYGIVLAAACGLSRAVTEGGIGSALQPYVNRHELAGAVALIASKDKVLSVEAVGYADFAARKPMMADCLFWIASMSKPITATALMMLVEDGKVRLDDPIHTYLPHFAPKIMGLTPDGAHVLLEEPRRAITVRNLLSHTGGMAFRSSLETPTLDAFPLRTRVESYSLEPLLFEPGSGWSYSNAGINTVGRIIEVVSGMSYEEFLQKRLFAPLGMKDTTFWPTPAQLSRLAKSYKPGTTGKDLEETPITQLHYPFSDHRARFAIPAGGLFSTAADLAKFCQMLLAGGVYEGRRYLALASIQQMTRNQVPEDSRQELSGSGEVNGYGLGWFISASGTFGHQGAYSTSMRIDPMRGLITIWLVQHAGFPGDGAKSLAVFEEFAGKHFGTEVMPGPMKH